MTLRSLDSELVTIFDGEAFQDNPVENKHRRLVRSHRNGPLDRELKPNPKIRDDLNVNLGFKSYSFDLENSTILSNETSDG